ncbi:hypothetical protein SDC9_192034 [bioreactor metagenome]|uniref:Dipeptidase n=1 Tax=bioreactor metagenome TaxID=1076179 RepID=A0A645I227_9ZZZZ
MGGGTYARKLKNAVGYGPAVTGLESDFGVTRGKGHQPDEYISFDIMKKAFFIYVNAIKELDKFV